ncbi:MAG: MgtC/SapB family protein [Xenococcaceae cyanobacterium MO_207.B15]|nr:MgtC/SapB family protein [Xenococcaceae cyanobacterium MO_207.B15]MDJ0744260.1 MgtC/SapB family protein [Xenococcaceae cyanobacterium MO_167.B27]
MTWVDFTIRLLVGFFLGVGIGIERQWLKTRAVLKTNVLVTLGSAMFVMLAVMTPGDSSPTRVSAQIVSGVGFLGGGVILREGASVRGINTAATLWCAAAVGTLVGSGHLIQAYMGTFVVVGANLLLRPLVEAFRHQDEELDYQPPQPPTPKSSELVAPTPRETHYCFYVVCQAEQEAQVFALLLKSIRERQWTVVGIHSKNIADQVEIRAEFLSKDIYYQLEDLEEVVGLLKSESTVSAVSWQFLNQNT